MNRRCSEYAPPCTGSDTIDGGGDGKFRIREQGQVTVVTDDS